MLISKIASYTRFVKSAKMLLGIFVVALTTLMFVYPMIKKNSGLRIAFTSSAAKPPPTQMINANYHGFDDKNQPYNITAKTAMQVDENNIVFDKINADLTLNDGVWLTLQANQGTMKIKERMLTLNGSIEMFDDEGYELRTESMDVDLSRKIAVSQTAVNGQGPLGVLKSSGAVFDGSAKTATFKGPVHVTIHLPPKQS